MSKWAKKAAAWALFFFFCPAHHIHASNVVIPKLELVTRGFTSDDVFQLSTFGQMDISFDGGSKFGGQVAFSYLNDSLEQPPLDTGVLFKGANITVKDVFSIPVDFSWFIGEFDLFCQGDAFTDTFGSPPVMTHYRGFLYFPNGIVYDGIHQIKGTGTRLSFTPNRDNLLFSLYAYQDSHFTTETTLTDASVRSILEPGNFSGDLRLLANLESVLLESFLGATYSPSSTCGYYRAGLLFYAWNEGVEFLAQVGVPMLDPSESDAFSIDVFYLLLEPRLHIGAFNIVQTFFWHPGYYNQKPTEETGSFDMNFDISYGSVERESFSAGIESNMRFTSSGSSITVSESPYVRFITFGIEWIFKVDVHLDWPLSLNDIEEVIGIRAEF